jgi:hypothetical protein
MASSVGLKATVPEGVCEKMLRKSEYGGARTVAQFRRNSEQHTVCGDANR